MVHEIFAETFITLSPIIVTPLCGKNNKANTDLHVST